uniref:Agamous-like MADS-box protein AGL36 n=1 Tax=Cicer arietinum TaxID=3827 RepID=A0A3Q7XMU7_CICAR|nr:agamous-like MADS-box protein AGL36 [Cicer arietinum]XP_027188188.1 agamous-like MADS-box protein AGL36 [Cicer arietinum]
MVSTDLVEKRRKQCYKRKVAGFLKEMEELTILCGIEACAIIQGPGDTEPIMWPSPEVAEQILERLLAHEEAKNARLLEETKRLEDELFKLNDKEKSILTDQINDDCKPLSLSEFQELNRLFCIGKERLEAALEKKIGRSEEALPQDPPPPPITSPLQNGIDSGANVDGKVSDGRLFLSLLKRFDRMCKGSDNNTGTSSSTVFTQGNMGGLNSTTDSGGFLLIDGNDSGSVALPPGNVGSSGEGGNI